MRSIFLFLPNRVKQLVSSVKNLGGAFWIGHLIVLVSTVLGVYLAASAGLDTALEFESLRYDRDNYYLRLSLREENNKNIQALDNFIDRARRLNALPKEDQNGRRLPFYFVYDSLLQNPNTLGTPTPIIMGVQQFYARAEHILDEGSKREITYAQTAHQLETLISDYKNTTLNMMDTDLKQLKQRLTHAGVPIYE